jgi:DNA repair photolyase
METVQARQLLTPLHASDHFFHSDYNLNLYRGCSHGCIYCDSRSVCYQLDRFDQVRVKEDALSMLREELRRKRKPGLVSTGAMSDPYNPFEKELEVTRGALLLLKQYGFGAGFTTKSSLAARDAGVLYDISRTSPVRACFSITCAEDALSLALEPNASPSSKRFEALETLSRAGVFAGVRLNPVLPFLTDTEENILAIVRRTRECGGRFVVCSFGMTIRTGNREYFYKALDEHFPGLKAEYANSFGLDYECFSFRAKELEKVFIKECSRLNLACHFPDINRAMFAKQSRQLSMFGT